MHVLTPNIYRTVAEAKQTFNYITDKGNFGFVDRELARWSGVAIMVRWTDGLLTTHHCPRMRGDLADVSPSLPSTRCRTRG